MRGLSTRQVLGRPAALLFSAAVLTGGATAAVIAPLPGAVWTVIADDAREGGHGGDGGSHGNGHGSSPNGGQDQHSSKPAEKPPAANPGDSHAQSQANQPAPRANDAAPGSTSNAPGSVAGGGSAPVVHQAVDAASTNQPADPKPSTQTNRVADDVLGASIGSLPGQLVDPGSSPIGASKDSGIAALLISLAWACLSGLLVVFVRRRLGRQRRDPDFVPMTLGSYDFRK